MQTIYVLLLIAIFQFLTYVGWSCRNKRQESLPATKNKTKQQKLPPSAASLKKAGSLTRLVGKGQGLQAYYLSQLIGDFLEPDALQEMGKISEHWHKLKIYAAISGGASVLKHLRTNKVLWETIQYSRIWDIFGHIFGRFDEIFVSYSDLAPILRGNSDEKWNDVCAWAYSNVHTLSLVPKDPFVQKLLLGTAEHVVVNSKGRVSRDIYPFPDEDLEFSPLMLMSFLNQKDAMLILLNQRCVEVDQRTFRERTALHFAAWQGSGVEACKALLDNNAYIDAQDFYGRTPLMLAANNERPDLVKLLLERGANKFLLNRFGDNALDLATDECRTILENHK